MTPQATTTTTTKTKKPKLDDATRMAKALSHPLRHRILARLNDRISSPVQLSTEFGEPLGNVSYHVRALLDLDCIELVDTAPRRGALEHYYRATRRAVLEDPAWGSLPASARRGAAGEWFKKTFSEVAAAIDAGMFDAEDGLHISHTPLVLDHEAWEALSEELRNVYERALELQAEAAERLTKGGEGELAASLAMLLYERAPVKSKEG